MKIQCFCLLFLLIFGLVTSGAADAADQPLVALAKKVLRGAIGITIDEAGNRVLGPTIWKYFKQIFMPVYNELEKRYPNMLLSEQKTEEAIERLSSSDQLQNMLSEGFRQLGEGQTLIIAELNRMDKIMEEHGRKITDTYAMTVEILSILKQDRGSRPTESLQEVNTIIDIDNIKQIPPHLRIFWKYSNAHKYHLNQILEHGKNYTPYRFFVNGYWLNDLFNVEPTEYRVLAHGRYQDLEGRSCRDIEETFFAKGQWRLAQAIFVIFEGKGKYIRLEKTQTYCRVHGQWFFKAP